jgi:aerobic-type carbon monoxide dehydrogenase small subunit (CoxS/CutS family)
MELSVNGRTYSVEIHEGESLLNVLRERLDLTGTKYGCGEGSCGACTVMIDGQAKKSCVQAAREVAGKQITTIEGLANDGVLHPVQEAFLKVEAFQCAYCAPGMIMSAVSLLKRNAKPADDDITRAMQGNICRCGTYPRIVKAIKEASNT